MASRRRCLRGFVCGPGGSGAAAGGAAAPHRCTGERDSADLARASPALRLARRHGLGRPLRAWAGAGPRREGVVSGWRRGGGGCLFTGGRRREVPLRGVPWAVLCGLGPRECSGQVHEWCGCPSSWAGGSLPPPARWAPGVPLRPLGRQGWNRRLAAGRRLIPDSEHPACPSDCLSLGLAFNALGRGVGDRWSRVGWPSPAWGSQCLAAAGTELSAADRDPPPLAGLKGPGAAPAAAAAPLPCSELHSAGMQQVMSPGEGVSPGPC